MSAVVVLQLRRPAGLPDRLELENRVLQVGNVGHRNHVRVTGRRPPGVVPGRVLTPGAAVHERDDGHLTGHDVLQLGDRLRLGGAVTGAGELGERGLRLRVDEPPEVPGGRLADGRAERLVQRVGVEEVRVRALIAPVDGRVEGAVGNVTRPYRRVPDAVDAGVEAHRVELADDELGTGVVVGVGV